MRWLLRSEGKGANSHLRGCDPYAEYVGRGDGPCREGLIGGVYANPEE